MNTLIVAPHSELGGVALVVRNLVQYLRSKGHSVRMLYWGPAIFPRPRPNRLGLPAVEFRFQTPFSHRHPLVSLAVFLALFPIQLLQLIWRIWRWRIDVVNIHYPADKFFYFALCRRLLNFNLVCSIHGGELFPGGKPQTRYSRSMLMLLKYADRIVTPSEDCRRRLAEVFPQYENKTVFIHNGIDFADFAEVPPTDDLKPKERYVLSVSGYKEQKAIDILIHAMEVVTRRHPDLKLILVGQGPLRPNLESLSEKLGLADRIEFHGPKSHHEVIGLVRGCEVFVLPSRFETFGIALVEAMACGRCVIASNTGGMPEIVRDGVNGILVDPENPSKLARALDSLLCDPGLRQKLGQAALNDVHGRFSLAYMGAAYERVFQFKKDPAHTSQMVPAPKPSRPL